MKTPREVLFDRHGQAEGSLDEIRKRVLAHECRAVASDDAPRSSLSVADSVVKLWQELILPCRRIWCGLAVVWLVILALNRLSTDTLKLADRQTSASNFEQQVAMREQRLLRLELLGSSMPSAAASPGVMPPAK